MCTILLAKRVHPKVPLVVAANRDEFYARPSLPATLVSQAPRIVAGIDEQRAGTWLGATDTGFFAAVTNQRTGVAPDPSRRSRGELVMELLRDGSYDAAMRRIQGLDPTAYNAFNLVFGDAARVRVVYGHEGESLESFDLADGVHVLLNDRLDSARDKGRLIASAARGLENVPRGDLVDALRAIFSDHSLPGFESVCIHTPFYGTRSSSIVFLEAGRTTGYWFSPQAVCRRGYDDVTPLFAEDPS